MTEPAKDAALTHAAALLTHYSFDLGGHTTEQLMNQWQGRYQANWLRLAVIEALYQGRYKAISVTQILALWSRRGQPIYHFNHEFERLICRKFSNTFTDSLELGSENFSDEITPTPSPPPPISHAQSSTPKQFESVIDTWPGNLQRRKNIIEPISSESEVAKNEARTKSIETQTEVQNTFKPAEIIEVDLEEISFSPEPETPTLAEINRTRPDAGKIPIDRFTPYPESSEFYQKLKAVAQPDESSANLEEETPKYIRDPEVERDLWSDE